MAMNNQSLMPNRGFVALMATITMSAVLLLLIVHMSLVGWSTRFMVLNHETKVQTTHVAHSCADQAILSLVSDSSYRGGTTTVSGVACLVAFVLPHEPNQELVTIYVQVILGKLQTTLKVIYRMDDVHINETPEPDVVVGNTTPNLTRLDWREIPELPEI